MPDTKTSFQETGAVAAGDEGEIDNLVRHYGITREQARRLIDQYGNSRRELEAAAGRLIAKRVL